MNSDLKRVLKDAHDAILTGMPGYSGLLLEMEAMLADELPPADDEGYMQLLRVHGTAVPGNTEVNPVSMANNILAFITVLKHGYDNHKKRGDDLQKFKDFVHTRIDAYGVPYDPDAEGTKIHGCRISNRLEWMKDNYDRGYFDGIDRIIRDAEKILEE